MHVLTMLSQKGGTGKSTLCAHLAVEAAEAGHTTLILDMDPQGSITTWWRARQTEDIYLERVLPENLTSTLDLALGEGVDLTIIDTPPSVSQAAKEAAARADAVLIPVRPGYFDVNAMPATADLMKAIGRQERAAFVLNFCQPKRGPARPTSVQEAEYLLADAYPRIALCPATITSRAAYAYALNDGRAVREFEPDGKAAREMAHLWDWTHDKLKEPV